MALSPLYRVDGPSHRHILVQWVYAAKIEINFPLAPDYASMAPYYTADAVLVDEMGSVALEIKNDNII